MSATSEAPRTALAAGMLGAVLPEPGELEAPVREEAEERLRELTRRLLAELERLYAERPPASGLEAVRVALEALEAEARREEQGIKRLLEAIDLENYAREQVMLFAARVDEVYEEAYKEAGRVEAVEPVLATLTAAKMLGLLSLRGVPRAAAEAAALLAALAAAVKLGRLDIVAQLPEAGERLLAEHLERLREP